MFSPTTPVTKIVNRCGRPVPMAHGVVEPSGLVPQVPSTDQKLGVITVGGIETPVYIELAYTEGWGAPGQPKIGGLEPEPGTIYLVPPAVAMRLRSRGDLLGVRDDGSLVAFSNGARDAFGSYEG